MELNIEEILSRGIEMGMDIGNHQKRSKVLRVIIYWIESMGMGSIIGVQGRCIRGFTLRMFEVGMVSYC